MNTGAAATLKTMPDQHPHNLAEAQSRARELHHLGRLEEALELYDAILRAKPDHFDALHMKGVICRQSGNPTEAARLIADAIAINPKSANALCNYGFALADLRRFADAIANYDRAIELQPKHYNAHYNRGLALSSLAKYEDALAAFNKAETIDPHRFELFVARGQALFHLKRYGDALEACDRALDIKPNAGKALANRAAMLRKLKRYAEALTTIDNAIASEPDRGAWHNTRGNILRPLGRYEESFEALNKALALNFLDSTVFYNRGMTLMDWGRHQEAFADFEKALALNPNYSDAKFGRALTSLRLGDFERGWDDYESRWNVDEMQGFRQFSKPRWKGAESLEGKKILIHFEQGHGDTIQFIRYAALLAQRSATVLALVQPGLKELAATVPGIAGAYDKEAALPLFDFHCPLMSLPQAFQTRESTIPAAIPYMRADPARVRHWDSKLFDGKRLRVGLAWSGSPTHRLDRERSIALRDLEPFLALPEIDFISLQLKMTEADDSVIKNHPRFHHPGQNFSETAAIISTLDLVVSVDTSMAHLAGALGRRVWTLLAYSADSRWMLDRSDSPWYPTMRLFRQSKPGDWPHVVAPLPRLVKQLTREG